MESQIIQSKIYTIRNHRVMLDFDLAEIYEVETKVFNQEIKRNMDFFPEDFMFQLTEEEWKTRWSQFVTSSSKHRGKVYLPYAFTELCKALHKPSMVLPCWPAYLKVSKQGK